MNRLIRDAETPVPFAMVLAVVTASTFLAMLAYAGPLGDATALEKALAASSAEATWMLASMSAGLAVALLPIGAAADRLGHRRVFTLGAALFAMANFVCAAVGNAPWFVVARVVAGVGAAGMIATGLGLVAAVTSDAKQRAATATWWSVSMGAGIAVGPLATGALELTHAWRVFYLLLAVGGLGLSATGGYVATPNTPATGPGRVDLLGSALLAATLGVLVTALVAIRLGVGTRPLCCSREPLLYLLRWW